jgi:succinoglycan biosynthesis protein ExoM
MPHICICICTYRRPNFLARLLQLLRSQQTNGEFTSSIVICDNDESQSARPIVEQFEASSNMPIKYCVEPHQSIAMARNKAVGSADGDFVACIDDDEFPPADWLLRLFGALKKTGSDAVNGPVKPYFDESTPKWVVKSRIYERATYASGPLTDWRRGRVNNILFKKDMLLTVSEPFDPQFRAGEDIDFVRRMMENGKTFFWCNEAHVFESVPAVRWRRSFIVRRSLLQGTCAARHPNCGALDVLKSVVAVPVYLALLPLALLFGQHAFMVAIAKVSYHFGKVMGSLGTNIITEAYVVD